MTVTTPRLVDEYPADWSIDALLADGAAVHVRPIRSEDAPALRTLFAHPSPESVYFRFFGIPWRRQGATEVRRLP